MLNSSNTTNNQDNSSLSASQVSTQPNKSECNYQTSTIEDSQVEPPKEPVAEQPGQVDPTSLQDTPVIHHITTLMDMIHKLQGQISTMTQQVNKLTEQAAYESLYRTVDEINPDPTFKSHDDPSQPLTRADDVDTNNMGKHVMEQDVVCVSSNTEDHDEELNSPIRINIDDLPSPSVRIQDFQARTYSEAVKRTSTPRTPQRVRPASSHAQSRLSSDPQRETISHNAVMRILLIGDC